MKLKLLINKNDGNWRLHNSYTLRIDIDCSFKILLQRAAKLLYNREVNNPEEMPMLYVLDVHRPPCIVRNFYVHTPVRMDEDLGTSIADMVLTGDLAHNTQLVLALNRTDRLIFPQSPESACTIAPNGWTGGMQYNSNTFNPGVRGRPYGYGEPQLNIPPAIPMNSFGSPRAIRSPTPHGGHLGGHVLVNCLDSSSRLPPQSQFWGQQPGYADRTRHNPMPPSTPVVPDSLPRISEPTPSLNEQQSTLSNLRVPKPKSTLPNYPFPAAKPKIVRKVSPRVSPWLASLTPSLPGPGPPVQKKKILEAPEPQISSKSPKPSPVEKPKTPVASPPSIIETVVLTEDIPSVAKCEPVSSSRKKKRKRDISPSVEKPTKATKPKPVPPERDSKRKRKDSLSLKNVEESTKKRKVSSKGPHTKKQNKSRTNTKSETKEIVKIAKMKVDPLISVKANQPFTNRRSSRLKVKFKFKDPSDEVDVDENLTVQDEPSPSPEPMPMDEDPPCMDELPSMDIPPPIDEPMPEPPSKAEPTPIEESAPKEKPAPKEEPAPIAEPAPITIQEEIELPPEVVIPKKRVEPKPEPKKISKPKAVNEKPEVKRTRKRTKATVEKKQKEISAVSGLTAFVADKGLVKKTNIPKASTAPMVKNSSFSIKPGNSFLQDVDIFNQPEIFGDPTRLARPSLEVPPPTVPKSQLSQLPDKVKNVSLPASAVQEKKEKSPVEVSSEVVPQAQEKQASTKCSVRRSKKQSTKKDRAEKKSKKKASKRAKGTSKSRKKRSSTVVVSVESSKSKRKANEADPELGGQKEPMEVVIDGKAMEKEGIEENKAQPEPEQEPKTTDETPAPKPSAINKNAAGELDGAVNPSDLKLDGFKSEPDRISFKSEPDIDNGREQGAADQQKPEQAPFTSNADPDLPSEIDVEMHCDLPPKTDIEFGIKPESDVMVSVKVLPVKHEETTTTGGVNNNGGLPQVEASVSLPPPVNVGQVPVQDMGKVPENTGALAPMTRSSTKKQGLAVEESLMKEIGDAGLLDLNNVDEEDILNPKEVTSTAGSGLSGLHSNMDLLNFTSSSIFPSTGKKKKKKKKSKRRKRREEPASAADSATGLSIISP